MNLKILKSKNSVMKKYPTILSALILLFVVSFVWGCFAFPTSITSNESFISSSYVQYGGYTHSAQVTEPNPIYAVDTILDESHPAYFYAMSPDAKINFSYGFIPSNTSRMEITAVTKIITSANTRKEDETPFWIKTYSTKTDSTILIDDKAYTNIYRLNVQDIQAVIDNIKSQLKYSQSASAEIVTSVTAEGIINGEEVTTNTEYILPITIEKSYYQLENQLQTKETINVFGSQEVTVKPTNMDKIKPFFISWMLLILTISFYVYNKYYFVEVEQGVIDYLQKEKDIADLSEWISEGTLPIDYESISSVRINSLKDLVNLSIDATSRVIHDESKSVYFCMSNDIMYLFCQGECLM